LAHTLGRGLLVIVANIHELGAVEERLQDVFDDAADGGLVRGERKKMQKWLQKRSSDLGREL